MIFKEMVNYYMSPYRLLRLYLYVLVLDFIKLRNWMLYLEIGQIEIKYSQNNNLYISFQLSGSGILGARMLLKADPDSANISVDSFDEAISSTAYVLVGFGA